MNHPSNRIYVRITDAQTGKSWYASAMLTKPTLEQTIAHMNAISVQRRLGSTYEAALESEYWAYRNDNMRRSVRPSAMGEFV